MAKNPQSPSSDPLDSTLDFLARNKERIEAIGPVGDLHKLLIGAATAREERAESGWSAWRTPLAVALTGLITLSGNFVFDYLRADKTAGIETAKAQNAAAVEAAHARKEFEYKILEKELDANKSDDARACVLGFLLRIGILSELNTAEIEKLGKTCKEPSRIPALNSAEQIRQEIVALGEQDIADRISDTGIDLILRFEAMEKAQYETITHAKPYLLPGGFGGINIGFAYDLARTPHDKFQVDWKGAISDASLEALTAGVGIKGPEAAQAYESLPADVSVPYEAARKVFVKTAIVDFANGLLSRIPESAKLSPHCFGAVLSVAIHRGYGFQRLASLREAIVQNNEAAIPDLLRAINDPFKRRHEMEARVCEGKPLDPN